MRTASEAKREVASVPGNGMPGACDAEGLCVLVAEDNELNAEIVCELLSDAGLVVDLARNGEEACDLFGASPVGRYDAVLMDVQMPRMDGYQATRCIRALDRPDAADVPIIAMSANAFSPGCGRFARLRNERSPVKAHRHSSRAGNPCRTRAGSPCCRVRCRRCRWRRPYARCWRCRRRRSCARCWLTSLVGPPTRMPAPLARGRSRSCASSCPARTAAIQPREVAGG